MVEDWFERFVMEEIEPPLRAGQKLEAVKRYMQRMNCSLMEAKQAVERLQVELLSGGSQPINSPDDIEREAMRLVEQQGLIAAVKYVRDQTGSGLADSKAKVEGWIEKNGTIPAAGQGCFGIVLVGVVSCLWLAWQLS